MQASCLSMAALLVLASGARVLPVALEGTERIQPIGASRPRILGPRPTVRIGPPMDFSQYRGLPAAKARRAITDWQLARYFEII